MTNFPDLSHPLRQSDWLAGFIDGEGHLGIGVNTQRGCYWPVLDITQRDDDEALMREVGLALGASITITSGTRDGQNPIVRCCVAKKSSLLGVVSYLDADPLRTKKASEYVIWRGAVFAYVEHGWSSPVIKEAKVRISAMRNYAFKDNPFVNG